jgi:MinD-like ATPase involved in chromosome partitioning or flagellar assembly/HD-like signal output (HDOD) protein
MSEASMTRTITITSGKGGAGKTNISVNLALHLAALGYRTCLFDADLGLANVNILLGLYPEYNLEDVILHQCDLKDVIIKNYEGIDIIPGSSGVERMANLEAAQIEDMIQSFSELDGYNFLVFDTSSGISRNVISFCLASSEVIVVITPEVTSLTDAYALLKILCLNGFKGSVRIVVNQCKDTAIARHAYTKFKETVKKYLPIDIVPLGIVVHDPIVEEAVKEQQAFVLLYPESNASKCIKSIAKRLIGDKAEDLEASDMSSFWTGYLKLVTSPLRLTAKKGEKEGVVEEPPSKTQEQGIPEPIRGTGEKGLPEESKDVLQPNNRGHIFKQIEMCKDLPSLPHVVLELIDVCNRDECTIDNIAQIISKDPALSAKVMTMVNSVRDRPRNIMSNVKEAVSFLGRDVMKSIAVSAAAHSYVDHAEGGFLFGLKQFWWHSLMCATLGKRIAEKTTYPAPDEAFLSGLLHDIGKLVLWVYSSKEYAKILQSHRSKPDLLLAGEMRLGATHCEVGGWMINRWNQKSFMADAVLYHHEPVDRILDALPLVKIVFVANALCSEPIEDTDAKLRIAEEVLGFPRSEVEELISLAEEEVREVAKSLDIEVEPPDASIRSVSEKDAEKQRDLARAVRDNSLLQGTFQNLLEASGEESILKVVKQGLRVLFDVHSVLFLLYDPERDELVAKGIRGNGGHDLINDLAISFQKEKSVLVRSLRDETILDSLSYSTVPGLTIIDKQIIRFLEKDAMLCLPMVAHKAYVGVIVLGIDQHHISHLRDRVKLLTLFANQAALALAADRLKQSETYRLKRTLKKIQEVLDTE